MDNAPEEIRERFKQDEEVGVCILESCLLLTLHVQSGALNAEDKSVDSLTIQLEAKRAQLEMNMHTNASVVDTYQRRQNEVGGLCITPDITLTHVIEDRDAYTQDRGSRRGCTEDRTEHQERAGKSSLLVWTDVVGTE